MNSMYMSVMSLLLSLLSLSGQNGPAKVQNNITPFCITKFTIPTGV